MNKKKKISFLSNFSKEEWFLNGHGRNKYNNLYLFEDLIPHIKKGKYLELGCGSGILSRFLHLFSGKDIILYGLDINSAAIKLAKENNPKFSNNFIVSDYFNLKPENFLKYSTIIIFANHYKNEWNKLKKLTSSIIKFNKSANVIIVNYDHSLLEIEDSKVARFILEIDKISNINFIGKYFFVINGKGNFKKIDENKLFKFKDKQESNNSKELLDGIIIKKQKHSLTLKLIKKDIKIKVLLTSKTEFFKRLTNILDVSSYFVRKIKYQDIKNEDIVSCFANKNNKEYTALTVQAHYNDE